MRYAPRGYVSVSEVLETRRLIAEGFSLAEIGVYLGPLGRDLDRALWSYLGTGIGRTLDESLTTRD